MARQPSVKVNGYEIGDHPSRRIVWAETEGLLEATKQSPWQSFETFSGPGRNMAGDMDYPVRRLSIVVRIAKQDSFLGKHEALATLAEIFSGQPAIVQVGSLYLEAEFQPPQVVKDAWKLTSGYLTVRFEGEAIPGTYWGEYGYEKGREHGIIIQDDRPDHPSLLFSGNSFTVTNPGTAPTEAVVSVTNTSLPDTTVYLLGAKGQMMPVNLDSTGYGRIDEAYGFLLYPGANRVQIVDASGSLIFTGAFAACFYGTRFRHIGNTDNRFADGQVFQHARTGPATYIGLDGALHTTGDGVARFGLPGPVVRRNLLAWSTDLAQSFWNKSGYTIFKNAALAPDGTVTAHKWVLNNGSAIGAANFLTASQKAAGRTWSVYAKAAERSVFVLQDGAGSGVTFNLATGTATPFGTKAPSASMLSEGDGWYRCIMTFPSDAPGTAWYQYINAGGNGNGSDGIYLWMPQSEAGATVSPPQPTNATGVDLTHPLNGGGLVLEGEFTNFLDNPDTPATQSKSLAAGTYTLYLDGTGSVAASVPVGSELVSNGGFDTDSGWTKGPGTTISGGKAAFDGTVTAIGTALITSAAPLSVVAGKLYKVTWEIVEDTGAPVSMYLGSNPGTPQRLPGVYTDYIYAPTNNAVVYIGTRASVGPRVGSIDNISVKLAAQATESAPVTFALASTTSVTFTVSGSVTRFGCVNLPFRPSHVTGTKRPDLCGIVPPHNELAHSHDLTASAWTKTSGASVTKLGTANTVTLAATTDAIYQAVTPASVPGTTRTAAVKLKLGTLSGSIRLRLLDQAGAEIASKTIATADLHATDARTFWVTGTPGASVTGLRVQLIGNSGTGTVIVESVRLIRGRHPGVEVQTGDTPIPAPVSPALDPAWQQNGRVRLRVLPPPISTGKTLAYLGYLNAGTTVGATLAIGRHASHLESQKRFVFERAHAGGSQARGVLDVNTTAFWDGAPHDVELEWTNYFAHDPVIGAVRRFMWQRVYIDGVLVAQQDVAALYGATKWAEIDPSRLISDGNVFAVLSAPLVVPAGGYAAPGGVILSFPTLPVGAIPDAA